jgi:hypothetical protein
MKSYKDVEILILVACHGCGTLISISRHIFHQQWYTCPCPIALLVRRNPQHRSLLTLVSATSVPGRSSYATFERLQISRPSCEPVYATNTSHCKQETFLWMSFSIVSFCPQRTHNRTQPLGSAVLRHGRHFDYWNQPLNMHMRICYLDCHEAAMCWYLVVHMGNLLHPLQLSYFYLWPFYWPSPLIIVSAHSQLLCISAIRRGYRWFVTRRYVVVCSDTLQCVGQLTRTPDIPLSPTDWRHKTQYPCGVWMAFLCFLTLTHEEPYNFNHFQAAHEISRVKSFRSCSSQWQKLSYYRLHI